MNEPYNDQHFNGWFIRTFSENASEDELVWHRDENDRTVEVLEGTGWKFQYDNQLPLNIVEGDHLTIKANTFHRLIKGPSNLKLRITESYK
jgi:quercetin dioxygenase-like cupin family protein